MELLLQCSFCEPFQTLVKKQTNKKLEVKEVRNLFQQNYIQTVSPKHLDHCLKDRNRERESTFTTTSPATRHIFEVCLRLRYIRDFNTLTSPFSFKFKQFKSCDLK